jgi:hypothetical protein
MVRITNKSNNNASTKNIKNVKKALYKVKVQIFILL